MDCSRVNRQVMTGFEWDDELTVRQAIGLIDTDNRDTSYTRTIASTKCSCVTDSQILGFCKVLSNNGFIRRSRRMPLDEFGVGDGSEVGIVRSSSKIRLPIVYLGKDNFWTSVDPFSVERIRDFYIKTAIDRMGRVCRC
ncbi:hypothetical protein HacjB3_02530 [Halalkalicoccus jeotgali B3]|uniref:Uncharacterized protein n=1 Tax=Halalkalicoccus jeotgali (strain DSM 18796 / CECT 7217 / JCM 14584 / KCTC 4019 / B3) TaxID=795797 RepID=D8J6M2_HALJB|nr:hypothetical protein HacjB3_02530 [Halalkalicoccus jeotgali B3]